jgi:hypothetical protein
VLQAEDDDAELFVYAPRAHALACFFAVPNIIDPSLAHVGARSVATQRYFLLRILLVLRPNKYPHEGER